MRKVKFADEEVIQAVNSVKVAKGAGSIKVLYGTVGSKPSQYGHQMEIFQLSACNLMGISFVPGD